MGTSRIPSLNEFSAPEASFEQSPSLANSSILNPSRQIALKQNTRLKLVPMFVTPFRFMHSILFPWIFNTVVTSQVSHRASAGLTITPRFQGPRFAWLGHLEGSSPPKTKRVRHGVQPGEFEKFRREFERFKRGKSREFEMV